MTGRAHRWCKCVTVPGLAEEDERDGGHRGQEASKGSSAVIVEDLVVTGLRSLIEETGSGVPLAAKSSGAATGQLLKAGSGDPEETTDRADGDACSTVGGQEPSRLLVSGRAPDPKDPRRLLDRQEVRLIHGSPPPRLSP